MLIPDLEIHAGEFSVAHQQVLIERLLVLLRRRHHERFEPEHALVDRPVRRPHVLLLAEQTHVPKALLMADLALTLLDRIDHRIVGLLRCEPGIDLRLERVELLGSCGRCEIHPRSLTARHRLRHARLTHPTASGQAMQSTRTRSLRSPYTRRRRAAIEVQV